MKLKEIEQIEMNVLLEAIFRRYGYDFRNYARSSLKRRLEHIQRRSKMDHMSDLLPRMLHDREFFDQFLQDMSITVTEMFRDPEFYRDVREHVVPVLKTWPFIKIWHAGCATGEEVYSMAILLKEEGYYDRAQIYATDFNRHSLTKAQEAIYPLDKMKEYSNNYNKAGGKGSFSDYYHARYGAAKIDESLKKNITFAHHNLVADGVFGEMHMILCRNVLIYFNKTFQSRALSLFHDSLCRGGFLCLGLKETIEFSDIRNQFEDIVKKARIYQKCNSFELAELTGARSDPS